MFFSFFYSGHSRSFYKPTTTTTTQIPVSYTSIKEFATLH